MCPPSMCLQCTLATIQGSPWLHVGFSEVGLGSPPSSTPLARAGIKEPKLILLVAPGQGVRRQVVGTRIKTLVRKLAHRNGSLTCQETSSICPNVGAFIYRRGRAYCGTNQWLKGPLIVAGCQLFTNGLLPGAEVSRGTGQRWIRAAPACAGLLASAPRAEKCHSRKQPVRSSNRSSSRSLAISGANHAGGRGDSGRVETAEVPSTGITV